MGDEHHLFGHCGGSYRGIFIGIPSIAVSLAGEALSHYETAAQVVARLVRRFAKQPISQPWLFNVNVPDVPHQQLQGMEVTRLGKAATRLSP